MIVHVHPHERSEICTCNYCENWSEEFCRCDGCVQAMETEHQEMMAAEMEPDDMAQVYFEAGIPNQWEWGSGGSETLQRYLNFCHSVKNDRTLETIRLHLHSEVVELDQEVLNVANGAPEGTDGVVGEAVDVILCALDMIATHRPDLSGADLQGVMARKLLKWKNKYGT